MLKEGELPENVDPERSADRRPGASARASCARSSGISSAPAGFVLPVQRWNAQAGGGWVSEVWQLAPRPAVPGAGRLADRLSAAARARCPTLRRRRSASRAGRPIRANARRACPIRDGRQLAPSTSAAPTLDSRQARCADRARPTRPSAGPHRARDRAARRQALRVHAAGRAARGLSRAARRGRGDGRRARTCRSMSKAICRRPIRA